MAFSATAATALLATLAAGTPGQDPPGLEFPSSEPALPDGDDLVRVRLIADRTSVSPGETFTLGVHFEIEPGWHVYWKNPGDSGRPVSAMFSCAISMARLGLPAYPAPEALVLPGDIVNYVYEDEVLLLVEATASAGLEPGTTLRLPFADCEWLVCQEICLVGSGRVSLELPVVAKDAPLAGRETNTELFERFRARVPRPLDETAAARLAWSGSVERPVLSIEVDGARELEVFPLPDISSFRLTGIEHAASEHGRSARLAYHLKRRAGAPEPRRAEAVLRLVGPEPDATERFYLIDHTLDPASRAALSGPR